MKRLTAVIPPLAVVTIAGETETFAKNCLRQQTRSGVKKKSNFYKPMHTRSHKMVQCSRFCPPAPHLRHTVSHMQSPPSIPPNPCLLHHEYNQTEKTKRLPTASARAGGSSVRQIVPCHAEVGSTYPSVPFNRQRDKSIVARDVDDVLAYYVQYPWRQQSICLRFPV